MEGPLPGGVIPYDMAVSFQLVFIGHQTVQADRAPGRHLAGADAYLRPESVPETVREAGRGIPVYAGAVHQILEQVRRRGVFRNNGIRMVRSVMIDMGNGFPDIFHDFDSHLIIQIFPEILLGSGRDILHSCLRSAGQPLHDLLRDILMQQQGLRRVAGRHILGLGVYDQGDRLVQIRVFVHINMTDAVRVAHNRDIGIVHLRSGL